MKKLNFTFFLTVLMSIVGLNASAHDIEVKNTDGVTIYYNFINNNTELAVTYRGSSYSDYSHEYTGNVVIPESVTYNEKTYRVTSIGNSAFEGCSGLTSIDIPNSVTSVGDHAFYYCSGLTSITIPNSVTSIGSSAFQGCSGLSSIEIPNSVTSIGNWAFESCSGLTSIAVENGNSIYDSREDCNAIIETSSNTLIQGCNNTVIPNSVTSIGKDAFYNCSGLTSVTIPNSVTSIGASAFRGCSGLTSVTIGTGVTSIRASAFSGCSKLTSINIPNSVTSIGSSAFYGCSGLTSITIPNSVTSIGASAFSGCSKLTSINIPNSVTSIGKDAFYNCSGLTSVTIGSGVTSIGSSAFYGCSGLQKVIAPDIAAWCGIEFGNKTANPLNYAHHLYSDDNTEITELVIPDGVTSIRASAFSGCSKLTSINIPNSVTSIGASAFSGCSGLSSIEIPNSVTSIGNWAFESCSGLSSIEIPNSVTSIGNWAFVSCSGLTSVTIPNSVTSIGDSAFKGTAWYNNQPDGLIYAGKVAYKYKGTMPENTSITIKDGTLGIAESAFYGRSGLTSITIPNSVTSIGDHAFYGCSGLTSVTIGSGVTSIGDYAFRDCSKLASVTIGSGVTSIGIQAFYGTAWYNNQPDGLIYAGKVAYEYKGTMPENTSITIKDGTLGIAEYAFSGCSGLTSITIPNSVTSIGSYAFNGCSGLTSVDIPNSVTSIGFEVFDGCSGLTAIYSYIENPTSSTGANFDSSNYSNATLYVPFGTKDKYLATDGWKNFTNIVEMAPTPEPSSDNTLAISNAEVCIGKQVVLPIDMNNVASIQAFQFDLYLPEGVTVAKDGDNEYMVELTSRAAKSHSISAQTRPDGAIRMICTSMAGAAFKGNEGTIVNVTLSVAPDMTAGNYEIKIKNIELSDGTPYNPADIKATLTVKAYIPGDVDGTGTVSVNDAVCIINYILGSPIEGFIEAAADLDGNGVITVNDVVILINDYILGGNSQNSLDLAFLQDVTADDDYLFINDITMKAGETTEVEVFMNTNRNDIQGLQCDIYLPDGMEFVPEEDGDEKYYADKGGRAAKSHSVAAQLMADGSVRVVETSTSGAKFKDNDQAVFYFTVKAKEDMVAGNYEIKLANMELSYGGTPINPSDRTAKVVITDPSAINGVNAEDAKSFVGKFIKDNKIIIMKHGKKHSVSGQGM